MNKILLILSAVCFSIGAIIGAVSGVSGLPINWISAGLAFYVWAQIAGSH